MACKCHRIWSDVTLGHTLEMNQGLRRLSTSFRDNIFDIMLIPGVTVRPRDVLLSTEPHVPSYLYHRSCRHHRWYWSCMHIWSFSASYFVSDIHSRDLIVSRHSLFFYASIILIVVIVHHAFQRDDRYISGFGLFISIFSSFRSKMVTRERAMVSQILLC